VEDFLHRASQKEGSGTAASPSPHEEKVVISGFAAQRRSRVAAEEAVRIVLPAMRHLPEIVGIMRGDPFREATGWKAEQVPTLLVHGGANVRVRPDVGESQLAVRPPDQVSGRANRGSRLPREIDADQNTKR
jgi:hypothetical protein